MRNEPGDKGYNGIKTFSTTTLLEPYLDQIDLKGMGGVMNTGIFVEKIVQEKEFPVDDECLSD